jgi:hypothetical protein
MVDNNSYCALKISSEDVNAKNPKDRILTAVPVEESQDLPCSWEDRYFDNEADVMAVFDYDYPTMEEAKVVELKFVAIMGALYSTFLIIFWSWASLFYYVVFYGFLWIYFIRAFLRARETAHWHVYSHHVCITRHGIVSVRGIGEGVAKQNVEMVSWDTVVKVTRDKFTVVPSVNVIYRSKSCCFRQKLLIKGLRTPQKFVESVQQMVPHLQDVSSGTEQVITV